MSVQSRICFPCVSVLCSLRLNVDAGAGVSGDADAAASACVSFRGRANTTAPNRAAGAIEACPRATRPRGTRLSPQLLCASASANRERPARVAMLRAAPAR